MLITDAPYAAGTPEHSEWVREVFIPTVQHQRSTEDRSKYGAESIGGELVNGQQVDISKALVELQRVFDEQARAWARWTERTTRAMRAIYAGLLPAWALPYPPPEPPKPTIEQILASIPEEGHPPKPLWLEPTFRNLAPPVDMTPDPPPPWREPWRR